MLITFFLLGRVTKIYFIKPYFFQASLFGPYVVTHIETAVFPHLKYAFPFCLRAFLSINQYTDPFVFIPP